MQSLKDYEREKESAVVVPPDNKTGIACPECGMELVDEGSQLFTKVPSMKRVSCVGCGFSKVVRA